MIHQLKILPEFFDSVQNGQKRFELRKDDRNFAAMDTLALNEWEPVNEEYTGRVVLVQVWYIMFGGQFGLEKGYVCMSIKRV